MTITSAERITLEQAINDKLIPFNTCFEMSFHFAHERLNDLRNDPPITIQELESIFDRLIDKHILSIVALDDGDTFNIRCTTSHINMPCGVEKTTRQNGTVSQKNILITIMRKENFRSKDGVEFRV